MQHLGKHEAAECVTEGGKSEHAKLGRVRVLENERFARFCVFGATT